MYTIGIIEQDKALGDAMEQVLDEKGYFTVRADSLTDAGELFQQVIVDMVVLDLEQKEFAGKEDVAAIWDEYLPRPGAGKAVAIDSAGENRLCF